MPPDAVRRLEAEAARRRLNVDDVIADVAAHLPPQPTDTRRRPAFLVVDASERGITDRVDDLLADGFGRD